MRSLPSVEFKFRGDEIPPPPPKSFHVEVSSCWSLITANSKNRVPSWLGLMGQSASTVPSYSVLCQVITLDIPTHPLSKPSEYVAILDMKSTYQVDVQLEGLLDIKIFPAVWPNSDTSKCYQVVVWTRPMLNFHVHRRIE
jgi:hypothetical protein